MKYAPVLISVYNRLWHFQQCVESLAKNHGADQTDLFVAIDAPYRNEDTEAVKMVYEYSKAITGFKSLTIFMHETNLGARENIRQAYDKIFQEHDRIIFSEDDNFFSPDFLDFTNCGLDVYDDREDILAICGYNYPTPMPEAYSEDTYIWTGFSAWGYATWKKKWNQIEQEPSSITQFLKKKKNIRNLDQIAEHYYPALQKIVDTGHFTGDTIVCYHLHQNSQYCVFPIISRVRNLGHDGSGEHCGVDTSNLFQNQIISDGSRAIRIEHDIKPNPEVYRVLKKYFRRPKLYRFKRFVKRIIRYNVSSK